MAEVTARLLETVLTGRNLLSPVLTTAAADVERYDAKVTAANEQAGRSAAASAQVQESSAAKVTASNARTAESSTATSAKVVAANSRAAESSRAFADITESSAARTGVAWARVATVGIPVVGAAIAVVTGKMAGDFQQLTTKLETTAGESHKNLAMVSQGMLDMAGKVGISATELAKGMYTVESAGYHGAAGLNVLKASAQGARQENADLGKVADAVSTILHDYHLPASDAAKVTSELVTAVSHGKTTFDELTGSLHSVTPLASVLHISLADVTGTLSAMTASGESADQATQNMADTLRHLANPTNTMIAEMAQLGISTDDLSSSLSTRGLSGTLQFLEQTIVNHVDPATRKVLLPALNQSKAAAHDLQIMIGQMPPTLAKASQALLDGSTDITGYTKAAKGMGGQQAAMALQFLSLYKSSDGFNNVLKAGGPAAQVFEAALAKTVGTSAGLNVMLQTTGENAAATNAAVKDIGKSSASTSGDIKGWDEVQGNFNQKLAQAGAEAKSLAIEAGQHLLPVLTGMVGWIGFTGLPMIGHFGSAIGDVAHWFSQLPAPVKDTAYALVALRLADHIGLLDRLGSSVGGVRIRFAAFRDEIQVQRTLWAMNERSIAEAGHSYSDVGSILSRTSGSLESAGAGVGRFGATLSTLSMHTMAGLKTAGSGLMDMFGGPWGLAIAGAVAVLPPFIKWIQTSGHVIDEAKVSTEGLTGAIQANNGAIDENVRRSAAKALQDAGLFKAAQQWGVSLKTLTDASLGNADAMKVVSDAAAVYKAKQDALAHSTAVQSDQTGIAADAYKKAGMQSDAWLKAINGVADTTSTQVTNARQIKEAVNGVATATSAAGITVAQTWHNNTEVLHGATGKQIADLESLNYKVTHLKNGDVVVTSNTKPARDTLDALINDYNNKVIRIMTPAGQHISSATGPGGTQTRAGGGPIIGPGTGTSDTAGLYALSNGEHVWTAAETAAAGGHQGVEALRKAVLASGGGRANGGAVFNMYETVPADLSAAAVAQAKAQIASLVPTFTGGGGGAGSAAIRALGMQIASSMGYGSQFGAIDYIFSHESGWNPQAQNPTSSAYGIPQFLNSTWAQYGGKTPYAGQQIHKGIEYMDDRYGSPNAAAAFLQAHHWYDTGGILPPGVSVAVNGTGGNEHAAVFTNSQWNTLQRVAAAMPGYGTGGGGYSGGAPAHVTVSLEGATVTGRFEFGTDGMVTLVDGRINGRLEDLYRKKKYR